MCSGSQTHPCWEQLPGFYQHWAVALGHATAEGLEEWISSMGLYEDEDLMLTNPLRPRGGQMEGVYHYEERPRGGQMEAEPVPQASDEPDAPPQGVGGRPRADVAARTAAQAPTRRDGSSSRPVSRISAVLGFRVFLGSQQWRVAMPCDSMS